MGQVSSSLQSQFPCGFHVSGDAILQDHGDAIMLSLQGVNAPGAQSRVGYFWNRLIQGKKKRGEVTVRGLNSPIRVRGPISVSPKAAQEEVASSRLCALREEGGGLHFPTHPTPSHSKIRTCVVFNLRLISRDIIFPKKLWPSKQADSHIIMFKQGKAVSMV